MVEHTSANAPARDWRLVMLAGGASFAVSYALFHYVFPVGRWVASRLGAGCVRYFSPQSLRSLPWR